MGITRRDLLAGGLSVAAVGAGYGLSTGDLNAQAIGNVTSSFVETPDPNAMEQDLGNGFDKLVWQPDGSAEVFFGETHGMDGFYIAHESDSEDEAFASCNAPRYGGSIMVPLLALLRTDGYSYPSRRFKLIGGEGTFSECSTWAMVSNQALFGTTGTTYFTVPERFEI